MTGSVLRTGGAGDRTGDDIDALVEARGTRRGDLGRPDHRRRLPQLPDRGRWTWASNCWPTSSWRRSFAEDKIELAKREQKASISRRNDEPMSIAMREVPKVLFGADHPLARHPEYDTIDAVTRDDLVAFHADYFGPDRTYLVVIGDFDTADMKQPHRDRRSPAGRRPRTPLPPDPEIP